MNVHAITIHLTDTEVERLRATHDLDLGNDELHVDLLKRLQDALPAPPLEFGDRVIVTMYGMAPAGDYPGRFVSDNGSDSWCLLDDETTPFVADPKNVRRAP